MVIVVVHDSLASHPGYSGWALRAPGHGGHGRRDAASGQKPTLVTPRERLHGCGHAAEVVDEDEAWRDVGCH